MRNLLWILLLAPGLADSISAQQLSKENTVRIHEFYRLAAQVQGEVWQHWSEVPAPLLLVTNEGEFLTHHPAPPQVFNKITEDFYARPRQFPTNLLATVPAFGPPSMIVIGGPTNTSSRQARPG